MPNWLQMGEALALLAERAGAVKLAQEAGKTGAVKLAQEAGKTGAVKLAQEAGTATLTSPARSEVTFYPRLGNLDGLQNPRTVQVDSVQVTTQKAWLKTSNKSFTADLYLDDKRVGIFDPYGPLPHERLPLDIRTVDIAFSNGHKFSVPEVDLSISPYWPRGISGKRGVLLNDAKIAATREAQLNFTQILGLKPGQELIDEFPFQQLNGKLTNGREIFPIQRTPDYIDAYKLKHVSEDTWGRFIERLEGRFASLPDLPRWVKLERGEAKFAQNADLMSKLSGERPRTKDYPFQWVDDNLTNGVISLPRVRPEGQAWRNLPIPAVPKPFWTPYLNSLEGQYVNKILPNMERFLERSTVVREPKLSRFQEEIKTVLTGGKGRELWAGNETTAEGIKLGHGVMFKQPVRGGQNIYVLEQADRAVYLLKNEEDAERIATGQWLRTDARKAGNRFVVHAGDWKTKLEQQIRLLVDELTPGK
jgi:hypothetical protein